MRKKLAAIALVGLTTFGAIGISAGAAHAPRWKLCHVNKHGIVKCVEAGKTTPEPQG